MINNVEDLITRIKEFELSATVWGWSTQLNSVRHTCRWIREQMTEHLDDFIALSIARFGERELSIGRVEIRQYTSDYIRMLINGLEDFLIEHIRTPQTEFAPDLEDAITKMIRDLNKFIFEMDFE